MPRDMVTYSHAGTQTGMEKAMNAISDAIEDALVFAGCLATAALAVDIVWDFVRWVMA